MLVLHGTLRQTGEIKTKEDKEFVKLWIEHETPGRDETQAGDLQILEFMVPKEKAVGIPPKGSEITAKIRAYVKGRDLGFQLIEIISEKPKKSSAA